MYIKSECYGISQILGIKCPLYSKITIHDVILGVKSEPDCSSDYPSSQGRPLNPICCRPSCNDCFQRAGSVAETVQSECNGLNACHVQPKWHASGDCDLNSTEYLAVAYNCHMPAENTDNRTTVFSIDENLCGRPPTKPVPLEAETTTSTNDNATTTTITTTKEPPLFQGDRTDTTSRQTTRWVLKTTSVSPAVSTIQGVLAKEASSTSTSTSTLPAETTTVSTHRPPTKRFAPTARERLSTITSFTRLEMSNPGGQQTDVASSRPVHRGATIGGVAAIAGLLVFILSLVMLRRRRRQRQLRRPTPIEVLCDSPCSPRRRRPMSPADDVVTPTSASQEGQCPWIFGPPDLNYANSRSSTNTMNIPFNIPVDINDPEQRPPPVTCGASAPGPSNRRPWGVETIPDPPAWLQIRVKTPRGKTRQYRRGPEGVVPGTARRDGCNYLSPYS